MIQELISTSSPKCLDGNAGFGIVAQTSGLAPNVARDINTLSGYSHFFPADDERNPVVFLHVIKRIGGVDRHILSRVADCGNDYSGRTNRIGHHLILEESDLTSLPCGPAAIASEKDVFCTDWNEKSQKLPHGKTLPNPPVTTGVCHHWQQLLGDADWGDVVAERIRKGDPISLVFEPGTQLLPLLQEVFALLPPALRWKTTFSTYFMRSQEPPDSPKIQVKCIMVGSDEMAFAKRAPNTLLVDLRKPSKAPSPEHAVEIEGSVAVPHCDDTEDIYELESPVDFSQTTASPLEHSRASSETEAPKPKSRLAFGLTLGFFLGCCIGGLLGILCTKFVLDSKTTAGIESTVMTIKNIVEANTLAVSDAINEAVEVNAGSVSDVKKRVGEANTVAEAALNSATKADEKADEAIKYFDAVKEAAKKEQLEAAKKSFEEAEKLAGDARIAAESVKKQTKETNVAIGVMEKQLDRMQAASTAVNKLLIDVEAEVKRITINEPQAAVAEPEKDADTLNVENINELKKKTADAEKLSQKAKARAEQVAKKLKEGKNELQGLIDETTKKERREQENEFLRKELAALPEIWKGLALPPLKKEPGILENSSFLWKYKDRVKWEIVPFVDLKRESIQLIKAKDNSNQKTAFEFIDQNKKNVPFIEFSLKKEGVSYRWNSQGLRDYNSTDFFPVFNYVFLSKLQVDIEGVGRKEIALWTPGDRMPDQMKDKKVFSDIRLNLSDTKSERSPLSTTSLTPKLLLNVEEKSLHLESFEKFTESLKKPLPIERYSIDLVKPGTRPEDVDKPENRLRLFEVK